METNGIKDVWKVGIEINIKLYSDSALNEMVVKSARKSINAIYPGVVWRLVVSAVIIFLVVRLFMDSQSKEVKLVNFSALIVISIFYFIWEYSAYKMRKYTSGMPVKEWLEYRIKGIEKGIKFSGKYNLVIYTISVLSAFGFYIFYQIVAKTPSNILNIVVIPIGLIIYLWIARRYTNRNYKEALDELQELYKQFEESNT